MRGARRGGGTTTNKKDEKDPERAALVEKANEALKKQHTMEAYAGDEGEVHDKHFPLTPFIWAFRVVCTGNH